MICICAAVFGALFAFENGDKVSPVVVGVVLPELAIGYYLVLMMIFGILIGSFLAYLGTQKKVFQAGRASTRLRRKVRELEKKLEKEVIAPKPLSQE